jgi:hypothetical protein
VGLGRCGVMHMFSVVLADDRCLVGADMSLLGQGLGCLGRLQEV